MRRRSAAAGIATAMFAALALSSTPPDPAFAAPIETPGDTSGHATNAHRQKASAATGTVATTAGVTHEQNDRVPEGSVWTQHYFPSSDGSGVELHADVLLPENLPAGKRVPVIMSASTYFGHAGEIVPEGWDKAGPSARFNDFIEGTDLFDKGYAFVMVDVRGFGGSTGCLDFGGPGDQADIRAAIDWTASRPWSTGAVGMYGKSFDAYTGLIGNNLGQDALKAVVAQEPVWDAYRLIHSNGVPRPNVVATASTYNAIATMPPLPDDEQRYKANARYEESHPACTFLNSDGYRIADPDDSYWIERDVAEKAKGTDTPVFVTQGFLEPNTKPEGMREFLENHDGPVRAWMGQWEHVRGNDRTADGRLAMGREGWFEETMSFYDQYLKGVEPQVDYPAYAVQGSTGAWRAQQTWPVVERSATLRLPGGSYRDDGGPGPAPRASGLWDLENASRPLQSLPKGLARTQVKRQQAGALGSSYFAWSEPLERATRITGTPRVTMTARGEGNVMVKLYDVAPDGTAVMFDEQVSRLDTDRIGLDLKSTDWTLASGHALAVEIGSVQTGDWLDTPSKQRITVRNVRLALDLDDPADDVATAGKPAPYLGLYRQAYTVQLPVGSADFTLPPGRGRG
jgi:putative CocE/NonD family hydrolase